jgi:hypothetical protein
MSRSSNVRRAGSRASGPIDVRTASIDASITEAHNVWASPFNLEEAGWAGSS